MSDEIDLARTDAPMDAAPAGNDAPQGEERGRSRSRSRSPRSKSRSHSRSRSPRRDRGGPRGRPAPPVVEPNNVLGVFGLHFSTREHHIQEQFSKFGNLTKVVLIQDRRTGDSKGYAFLTFATIEDATNAKNASQNLEMMGRKLRVDYSSTAKPHDPTPGRYMGAPHQIKRREESSRSYRSRPYRRSRSRSRSRSPRRRRYSRSRSRSRSPRRRRYSRSRSRSPRRRSRSRSRSRSRDRRRY